MRAFLYMAGVTVGTIIVTRFAKQQFPQLGMVV